jgi:phosphoribosylpyrophosphate synthetase
MINVIAEQSLLQDEALHSTILLVFPDQSAYTRYTSQEKNFPGDLGCNSIFLRKKRENDQVVSGSMRIDSVTLSVDMQDIKTILFVDDLLMGGATFVQGLRVLKDMFGDLLKDKTKIIAVPQIVPEVYHNVFPDFDKVITMDHGYSIPAKYKEKTHFIKYKDVFNV